MQALKGKTLLLEESHLAMNIPHEDYPKSCRGFFEGNSLLCAYRVCLIAFGTKTTVMFRKALNGYRA